MGMARLGRDVVEGALWTAFAPYAHYVAAFLFVKAALIVWAVVFLDAWKSKAK